MVILSCIFETFTWYQRYDNMMWYHVRVELRLRECYQAMPFEAISEDYWLGRDFEQLSIG